MLGREVGGQETLHSFSSGPALTMPYDRCTLAEALRVTLTPHGDGQVAAQRALVDAIQAALEARRQRIILSGSSVNWVKWLVLLAQATLTLVTIAMVHADAIRFGIGDP